MKKLLAILLSALTLLSCGLLSACSAEKAPENTDNVWETVSEAYIYAFPLVLTDATKTLSTNTDGTMPSRAPVNQFNHAKKLADASFRTVVLRQETCRGQGTPRCAYPCCQKAFAGYLYAPDEGTVL